MARSTNVAVAVNALVVALNANPLPGLTIIDGPPRVIDDLDILLVAFSATAPDVEIAQVESDLGGGRDERLTVACVSSSRRGEHDLVATQVVRLRAVEIIDWVADTLELDPTLGDVVSSAEVGLVGALDQAAGSKGTDASIEFAIVIETL